MEPWLAFRTPSWPMYTFLRFCLSADSRRALLRQTQHAPCVGCECHGARGALNKLLASKQPDRSCGNAVRKLSTLAALQVWRSERCTREKAARFARAACFKGIRICWCRGLRLSWNNVCRSCAAGAAACAQVTGMAAKLLRPASGVSCEAKSSGKRSTLLVPSGAGLPGGSLQSKACAERLLHACIVESPLLGGAVTCS